MTVCISALALETEAIICVADKALSYGDQIQWDSDVSKIIPLNENTVMMFSGGENHGSKILANLSEVAEQIGGTDRKKTISLCERQYKNALDELVEAEFLTPRLLKRENYLSAITGTELNDYIRSIAEEIDKFKFDCDLLVSGIDEKGQFIWTVCHPGILTDMTSTGFHAIGSGSDKAISRLLFAEHKRGHDIDRALYDAFDAKASAEMAVGVGYEWDAVILLNGVGYCPASKEIKDLVERAWAKFNRSPFDKYNPKEDVKPPPKGWKNKLQELVYSQFIEKLERQERIKGKHKATTS